MNGCHHHPREVIVGGASSFLPVRLSSCLSLTTEHAWWMTIMITVNHHHHHDHDGAKMMDNC
jgi:hypothetical protein